MPRDQRGWEVAPAPDGRGTPPVQQRPPHRTPGFLWFVAGLFALNILLSVLFSGGSSEPRVTVPFSPYFIAAVDQREVASITTKGASVQGTFKVKQHYPAGSATATKLFATQVPAFWNGNKLEALLTSRGVTINAESTTAGTSVLAEILLGFGPTLLLVGLFVLLARRAAAAGGGMGALGAFGRSQARRVDPDKIRVTFADVAGIDEAKGELTEIEKKAACASPATARASSVLPVPGAPASSTP